MSTWHFGTISDHMAYFVTIKIACFQEMWPTVCENWAAAAQGTSVSCTCFWVHWARKIAALRYCGHSHNDEGPRKRLFLKQFLVPTHYWKAVEKPILWQKHAGYINFRSTDLHIHWKNAVRMYACTHVRMYACLILHTECVHMMCVEVRTFRIQASEPLIYIFIEKMLYACTHVCMYACVILHTECVHVCGSQNIQETSFRSTDLHIHWKNEASHVAWLAPKI
jgi:hypothetical protein